MGNAFTLSNTIDLKKLAPKNNEILVGWKSGDPHAGTGEDIAEIARKLTFGAGPQTWTRTLGGKTETFHVDHIPARPILEDGIYADKEIINAKIAEYWKKVISGESARNLLESIGAACVGAVQKFARMGGYSQSIPNSKKWAEFKQGDKPWLDTGQVIDSTTYVTHEEGK